MTRFESINGRSEMSLAGDSSIHPLHTKATEVKGYFEATLDDDGLLDLSEPVAGKVEIPVDSLRSGNALIDKEMQSRLNTRRYPRVMAEVVEIEKLGDSGKYRAIGDLTFHGVKKRLTDKLEIELLDENTIQIQGKITIDVRQFNVEPPKLMMLKVYPEVTVSLHFVAARVD
jgi:polyisoprenoid-binding protein YceI